MTDFTSIFHRTPYPGIDPSQMTRSQAGRTIVITGGSGGIGLNIAEAFALANASKIILVARTKSKLNVAVEKLIKKYPGTHTSSLQCDLTDTGQIQQLWASLGERSIFIDVLVLNASPTDEGDAKDLTATEAMFQFSILSNLHMFHHFHSQRMQSQRFLVNITTAAAHCYPFPSAAVAASRAGFASYLSHMVDSIAESEMRIVSLHPGCVFTERSHKASRMSCESAIWDDPSLSAHMAVWITDVENAFLHGRFLWANWDAEELVARKEEILLDKGLMKIGLMGVGSFSLPDLFAKCQAVPLNREDA